MTVFEINQNVCSYYERVSVYIFIREYYNVHKVQGRETAERHTV